MKKQFLFFSVLLFTAIVMAQSTTGRFDLVVSPLQKSNTQANDTISYYFGEEKTAVIIQPRNNQPTLRLIFNPKDATISGLYEANGKKGGYVLPMNKKYWPGMDYVKTNSNNTQKKLQYTGETKQIQGFTCKEIIAESDDYLAKMWVTEEIPISMLTILAYQTVGTGESTKELDQFKKFGVENLPLVTILKSKANKGDVLIRALNLRKNFDINVFNTEGYTLSKVEK